MEIILLAMYITRVITPDCYGMKLSIYVAETPLIDKESEKERKWIVIPDGLFYFS